MKSALFVIDVQNLVVEGSHMLLKKGSSFGEIVLNWFDNQVLRLFIFAITIKNWSKVRMIGKFILWLHP